MSVIAVGLLGMAAPAGAGTPPLPVISNQVFIVTNTTFAGGAYGNGSSNSAAAINAAITYASGHGGGTVEIPAVTGGLTNYMSGPITMASHVNLQIDSGAMLQMFPLSTWTNRYGTSTPPFVSASGLTDIEISGSGTMDGQGTNWWVPVGKANEVPRPNFIDIGGCTRVLIQNVKLQNPPTFTIYMKSSDTSVTIQGITIDTPFDSHNTDAFDITSTNVLIQNCHISTGDDDAEIGGTGAAATDITISNCWFGTGHGVSIGSYTGGGVNNLLVSNCTWVGTEYGIKMKTQRGRGGLMENLKYCDMTMTNVNFPFAFYMAYDSMGSPSKNITNAPAGVAADPGQAITGTTPIFRNVTISNLKAWGNSGIQGPGNIAGMIFGLPESPISNVTLSGVNISGRSSDGTIDIYNARGIQIIDSNLTAPLTGTNVLTLYNAQVTVTNSVANTNWVTITGLGSPSNSVLSLFNGQAGTRDASVLGASPLLTLAGSTLTVSNNMSVGSSSSLNYGLGTNATKTVVTGNLTLGGTLNVADGGGFNTGTYSLFTYGGTLTYNTLTVGAKPNINFAYQVDTNTIGVVKLDVTSSCSVGAAGPISGSTSVASGTNGVSYSISSVSGATTYAWTVPSGASIASGQGTTSITVNYGCSAVSGNVTVTPSNGSCNGTLSSQVVTVTAVGVAGSISGLSAVCSGQAGASYSISSVSGATTYTWAVPSGASIAGGQGSTSITVNWGASSGNVTVTPANANGCTGTLSSQAVTVTAVGAAGSISGSASVASGTNGVAYSISSVSGATTYTWAVPSGASIASGQGTTSITVNYGCSAVSGNVTVTPSNGSCSGTLSSRAVTVTAVGVAGSISGLSAVCSSQAGVIYSISSVSGATTYTWAVPSGASIAGGQGSTSITVNWGASSGNVTVTPANANGCTGTLSSQAVTVNPLPTAFNVTGGGAYCAGGSGVAVGLSGSQSGVNYQLLLNNTPTGLPVAGTGSAISFGNQTATGNYTVVAVGATTGCTATMSGSATVVSLTDPFQCWQMQYFGCTACPQAAPDADPLGKGMSNTNQFLAGLNPTNSLSALRIISVMPEGNDIAITWTTAGVRTNAVQATIGDGSGGYSMNFTDISAQIILPVSGDAVTNYVDVGGATNVPSRYYRIRLLP